MSFQQFVAILIARYKILLGVLFSLVIVTLAFNLWLPKQYTAVTTVLVDVKSPDPILGALASVMATPSYMATQVDIINSQRVAERVVKSLEFEKVTPLVQKWKEESKGRGTLESYYGELLSKSLEVKPSRESNVISIEFTGTDPKFSATVANAFAQAYIDTSVELQVEPAKQYNAWFEVRAKQMRERLEKAQSKLSEYQQKKGILSVDERLDVESARLNELSSQLVGLQTQKSEAQSRQREIKGNMETHPDIINNPVIQNLRTSIANSESKLKEMSNQLGKNHPQIKQQEIELESLKSKLASESANVASSLGTNTQVSTQKESEVRIALEAQKQKILDLKNQRDEGYVLTKDVEAAQRDYEQLTLRQSQKSLESQSQQTNLLVLTPASEPLHKSRPRTLLNVLLAGFIGLLLGVGAALSAEAADRRVRSIEDLAQLGIAVLGTIVATRSKVPFWKFWHRRARVA